MAIYIGGYNPIKILEVLLNVLIQKRIITKAEAEQIVQSGKAPE